MRRVVELFAGVGGFRIGLNQVKLINNKTIEKDNFKFVFFNQWEPSTSIQSAYNCYIKRFNENHKENQNIDISLVDKKKIPDHDLLVAGFPCQDYSVARSLNGEKGIKGKKGVLWWEIYETLLIKSPNFVLLENVDRLLISPSTCRGRDFSIILKCFDTLNYYVEWKIIKASDYGMPQKRKRVFIFACKKSTNYFKNVINRKNNRIDFCDFVNSNNSFFTKEFNCKVIAENLEQILNKSLQQISEGCGGIFYDTGVMIDKRIYTFKTIPIYKGKKTFLKDILLSENNLDNSIYLKNKEIIEKFQHLKSKKKIAREKDGYTYFYSEGKMNFPDDINLPARTMLTSEGTVNRSTHIIGCSNNRYRLLTPIECERLNMFPDNWTKIDKISDNKRKFMMGNALVCGIIEKLSNQIKLAIDMEKN